MLTKHLVFIMTWILMSTTTCAGEIELFAAPPTETTAESLMAWSVPGNGLVARVEHFVPTSSRRNSGIYIRLQNIDDEPVNAPIGRINLLWMRCFELYLWDRQRWRPEFWEAYQQEWGADAPAMIELLPGESCIAILPQRIPDGVTSASHFKIVIRFPVYRDANDRLLWSGHLETKAFPASIDKQIRRLRKASATLPTYLPWLPGDTDFLSTLSIADPYPVCLYVRQVAYRLQAQLLDIYNDGATAIALDKIRQRSDPDGWDVHEKLLLALLAARRESNDARQYILQQLSATDYETMRSAIAMVDGVLSKEYQPDWAIEAALELIEDERVITRQEDEDESEDPDWPVEPETYTVKEIAADEYLARALGRIKCKRAVPTLLRFVDDPDHGDNAVYALGEIGDPRAITPLLALLKQDAEAYESHYGNGASRRFNRSISALAQFGAQEAVPFLNTQLDMQAVRESIARFGDHRSIEPLRGWIKTQPADSRPRQEAELALVVLENVGVVPRLRAMLIADSSDEYFRLDVIRELELTGDPRAVPVLLEAIQTQPHGSVVSWATWAIKELPIRQAVEGLIDCLEVDYSNRSFWKPAYTNQMFRRHIAEALQDITGQPFGIDPPRWRAWFDAHGEQIPTELLPAEPEP